MEPFAARRRDRWDLTLSITILFSMQSKIKKYPNNHKNQTFGQALRVTGSAIDSAKISRRNCARGGGIPLELCKLCPACSPALPRALSGDCARDAGPARLGALSRIGRAEARGSCARPTVRTAGSGVGGGARSPARSGSSPGRLLPRLRWSF